MISNDEFKQAILAFLKEHSMSPTTFGFKAKNDPSFVSRVMSGQEVRESGKRMVLNFMSNYEREENE